MRLEALEKLNKGKRDAIIAAGIKEFSQKSYTEASTDIITRNSSISKGLLFHYFGSKKEFYLYCLSHALDKLTERIDSARGDFYMILFGVMDEKLKLCAKYPDETRFLNMASRETASEISEEKTAIFGRYALAIRAASAEVIDKAILTLHLKTDDSMAREGLQLYINAIINKYLLAYQYTPDEFFSNAQTIKLEMKEYIDLMLYGVVKEV